MRRDIRPKSHWQMQSSSWNSSACKCLRWSKYHCAPTIPEFLSGWHRLHTTDLRSYDEDRESGSSAYRSFAGSAGNAVWYSRASRVHRFHWHRYNQQTSCNKIFRTAFGSAPVPLSSGAAIPQTAEQAADCGSWPLSLFCPFEWSCSCRLLSPA